MTCFAYTWYLFQCISIHTTTQVVTRTSQHNLITHNYFNPHHHAGGDGRDCVQLIKDNRFQSTPPRRWWQWVTYYCVQPTQFQSTPPRRWWLYKVDGTRNGLHFNPHHHAGGDSKSTQLFILISVNFHINLLLQPLTTSKPSKSIPKTPTIPDSPGANLPGVSWVLPIRTGVSEN